MLEDVAYISLQVKVVVTQSVQGSAQVASFLKHFKRFYFHCNVKFFSSREPAGPAQEIRKQNKWAVCGHDDQLFDNMNFDKA